MRYIKTVQLLYFSNTHIHHLSGGMKLCLAIALAMNPKILLINEPFFSPEIQTRSLYDHSNTQRKNNFVCNVQHR
jgi:NitT/TauT family transport system ATP-binding protein